MTSCKTPHLQIWPHPEVPGGPGFGGCYSPRHTASFLGIDLVNIRQYQAFPLFRGPLRQGLFLTCLRISDTIPGPVTCYELTKELGRSLGKGRFLESNRPGFGSRSALSPVTGHVGDLSEPQLACLSDGSNDIYSQGLL